MIIAMEEKGESESGVEIKDRKLEKRECCFGDFCHDVI